MQNFVLALRRGKSSQPLAGPVFVTWKSLKITMQGVFRMHNRSQTWMLAAGIAILLAGCSKPAEQAAVETPAAEPAAALAEPAPVEPMVAAATDPNQIGTASVSIGWQNNALVFASTHEGFCVVNGGCREGMGVGT